MVETHFRSPAAHLRNNQAVYRSLYEGSPHPYLLLTPDLKIINGNDAFVSVTRVSRDLFAGRYMFDAFPESNDPANTGVRQLLDSFNRVLQTKQADTLKFQRYDVQNAQGVWERRVWDGTSWAVADKKLTAGLILGVKEYTTDEVTLLLNEARTQVEQNKKLIEQGKKILAKLERLSRDIKRGRLDQLKTLHELLAEWKITIH